MHGGDIYRQQVTYDFSVNINPLGLPAAVQQVLDNSRGLAMQYPDLQCQKLRMQLADRLGIRPEQILCGNGASELILAVCQMLRPQKALLSAPCFSGYETALQAVGTEVIHVPLSEAEGFAFTEEYGRKLETRIREEKPELLFLTTPNNPTGKLTEPDHIRKVLAVCGETGTYLVLDECFMELTGQAAQYSMLREIDNYENLLILRAFTKTFAMPGIRLGYLVGQQTILSRIQQQLPEWNVSTLAQAAGVAALADMQYLEKACGLIESERNRMSRELRKLGCMVYPSDANYIMFYVNQSSKQENMGLREGDAGADLKEKLSRKQILIRDCSDYPGLTDGYYRVAVKLPKENQVLLEAIAEILKQAGE
ncbi:aminotransferase class I/II-fold pyridoxal phosphate-dependent enzyme [Kineothrix sp. MSJ-39]|uniref:pyridoxal phosphate-dependent aminotransferase n=1 Tax=Kineothrix sp. MSJ-39 TaxID=2841533 RepID=UPI001C11F1D7|nr:histidinol-phosphate transaminase [Kineothrix sp. MSJ-39]MBU5430173.1 aminotransferase class I/II-fold pyridoxal phosphate-dependent enzyme [Kineothrix sp. MSJ-39]